MSHPGATLRVIGLGVVPDEKLIMFLLFRFVKGIVLRLRLHRSAHPYMYEANMSLIIKCAKKCKGKAVFQKIRDMILQLSCSEFGLIKTVLLQSSGSKCSYFVGVLGDAVYVGCFGACLL